MGTVLTRLTNSPKGTGRRSGKYAPRRSPGQFEKRRGKIYELPRLLSFCLGRLSHAQICWRHGRRIRTATLTAFYQINGRVDKTTVAVIAAGLEISQTGLSGRLQGDPAVSGVIGIVAGALNIVRHDAVDCHWVQGAKDGIGLEIRIPTRPTLI